MDDLRFDGQVAVVTGAGHGLGRSYALELGRRGAAVVVNDLGGAVDGSGSATSAADAVAAEIEQAGGRAVANHDTVATPEGGVAIIRTALDTYGRVDILVNNAGILRPSLIPDLTPDLIDSVIAVHLRGAFHVTQPAFVQMQGQGYGRIVSTTSGAGLFGVPGQANYASAKMGIVGLTRTLAAEGAEHGITANAVAPIATTRMTEQWMGELAAKFDPGFVTPVVCWLAHRDCTASGEIYTVGGGHVHKAFVAITAGWTEPAAERFTAEAVRDHFAEIGDETGSVVPRDFNEEMGLVVKALG